MKYLLIGYGSRKNKGCEALLITTINQIRDYDKNAYITVAVFDYDYEIKNPINGVDKYIRHNHLENLNNQEKEKLQELRRDNNELEIIKLQQKEALNEDCDICLSIGGDNYSAGNVPYLHVVNERIKSRNKILILWGCSLYENIEDDKLIEDLKLFDLIIARESLTFKELKKFISDDKLLLLPDPAFALKASNDFVCSKYGKYICVNISDIILNGNNNSFQIIIDFINHILKKYSYNIILLPHVYVDLWNDFKTLEKIKKEFSDNKRVIMLDEKEYYNAPELKKIISQSEAIVAARTHASIAGYSTNIPTLVLGYSLKSKGIALDLFDNIKDYVIPYEYLDTEILIEKFDSLLKNAQNVKTILKNRNIKSIKESKMILIKALNKVKKNKESRVCNNCVGCYSCYNICPAGAIEMKLDNEGFIKAQINLEKCIKCGKCYNSCPQLHDQKNNYIPEAFAFSNSDENILKKSSSGGFFYEICKLILKDKGVVYGATYNNKKINFIGIDNLKDFSKICGSKYVESNVGNTFKEIKEKLERNKKVVFSGTPCQVAGLKKYLNKDYENLLLVSVVCHGVPSQSVFEKYLDEWEKENNDKVININFRRKSKSWIDFGTTIEGEKIITYCSKDDDIFMKGFLNNYYLKENCYNCKYHLYDNNVADIVLGDFWGVNFTYPKLYNNFGVSLVIANSKKGLDIIKKLISNPQKIDLSKAIDNNICISKSVKLDSEIRNKFFINFYNTESLKSVNLVNDYVQMKKIASENQIINKELNVLNNLNENFQIELNKQKQENEVLDKINKELSGELNQLKASKSWRITKPLRIISNRLRGK